jgi:DNA-binding transcriptional MocR family regulator
LLSLARRAGVDFVPSAFVMPDRQDSPALRLSFSRTTPEDIEKGIKTLCSVITDCINKPELLESGASTYEELFS